MTPVSLWEAVFALDQYDPLAAMQGMFDDDITDLSTTVRQTMAQRSERSDI